VTLVEAGPDYPDPATLPPEIASGRFPAFSHDWATAASRARSVESSTCTGAVWLGLLCDQRGRGAAWWSKRL
jgi:hypothetical protein